MAVDWTPMYINTIIANKSHQSVDADYWNALWNLVITQADHNTEGIELVMTDYARVMDLINNVFDEHGRLNIEELPEVYQDLVDSEGNVKIESLPSDYQDLLDSSGSVKTEHLPADHEDLLDSNGRVKTQNLPAYFENLLDSSGNVKYNKLPVGYQDLFDFNGKIKTSKLPSTFDPYPVGSIYLSVNNVNPHTYFGGTWVAWGTGRVPVSVDTSDVSFNAAEKTGGEKAHTLTQGELPAHTHGSKTLTGKFRVYENVDWNKSGTGIVTHGTNAKTAAGFPGGVRNGGNDFTINATHAHANVGNNEAHNNLQPYITCYMWKRIA